MSFIIRFVVEFGSFLLFVLVSFNKDDSVKIEKEKCYWYQYIVELESWFIGNQIRLSRFWYQNVASRFQDTDIGRI